MLLHKNIQDNDTQHNGTVCFYSYLSLSGLNFQVLHSRVGSWPHPQTLDLAGKACQGQML